jgi:signal transduction histidine kinase
MNNPENLAHDENQRPIVLVVDDIAENQQVVGVILDQDGYDAAFASDGQEALDLLKVLQPDIILLDISMPGMDGFEVCRRIKSNPATAFIPVIFLTAHNEISRVVEGFQNGAVDYIVKPFNSLELLARIHTHVSLARARTTLQKQNTLLQEMNTEISELISIAAHELKNPLQGLLLSLDMSASLLKKNNPRAVETQIEKMHSISKRMLEIIEQWLHIHSAGTPPNEVRAFPLQDIISHSMEIFQDKAALKKITLKTEIQPTRDVYAHPKLVLEILDNLISNALKFSFPGSAIIISLVQEQSMIRLDVKDHGPGIPEHEQKQLFKKFSRLSTRPTAGESSTGLGLAIVKKLAESMQGSVSCTSSPGNGALFSVHLPAFIPDNKPVNE